ncbi:MAG: leucine-rich repeat domain-containing protein [Calditrichae bacterium]|nr:leucine-rich repeat domain-containing protein [Calditrichia bacterium]
MAQHDLTPAKQLIQKCRETRDPYLDLGQCGITDLNDLPELFECSHLETLILSNRWRDYDKRTWINSSNTGPKNKLDFIPQEIAQLKNLAILIIGGEFAESWGISDIRSLGMLTSLQSLIISNNQIPDIRSLEKLTGLQALDLSSNQISDIQFLEKLTGLQSLSLSNNQISNIRGLEKLTGLQSLDLSSKIKFRL